jgi:hypothetical protein
LGIETKGLMNFTMKNQSTGHMQAAQMNFPIEVWSEVKLRSSLIRRGSKGDASAGARAGRRMAQHAFPGF